MFIDTNKRRINIYAPFSAETEDGVVNGIDLTNPENREQYGVVEIPDPLPPADYSDELYFRTEQDDAPYVVFTPKPDEMVAQARAAKRLAEIDEEIIALEASQARAQREVTTYMFAFQGYQVLLSEFEAAPAGSKPSVPTVPTPPTYSINKLHEIDDRCTALRAERKTLAP
jgi:hypothetical protein